MNSIAANIEAVRKKVGVKQEVLAEKLGVSQGTYSGYLTQNQDIRYGRILEIANKLNVPVIDIITWPEKYVPESDVCGKCREKDEIIKNLNNYIKLLTNK
jgi:transcriptional regulator with XRE-family HTH domain